MAQVLRKWQASVGLRVRFAPPPSPGRRRSASLFPPPQDVSATRADFYLALPLQPCGGPERSSGADSSPNGSSTPSGGAARQRHTAALKAGRGGSKRLTAEGGCEVAVVFPRLRPRLSLLRQVYQQLSPLLAADLESLRHGAVGGPSDEDGEEPPLPQPPLREEEIEESELR